MGMSPSGNNTRAIQLFQIAASEGQLGLLKWGQQSGFNMHIMLGSNAMANAALNGHIEVMKYPRMLGFLLDSRACSNAA